VIDWEQIYASEEKEGINGYIPRADSEDNTYGMFIRWKSPARFRIPSILSLLGSNDSLIFSTLAHPCHTFIAEAVVSLTAPGSSNDLTTSFSNTLVAFSSFVIQSCENGRYVRVGLCEFGGFRVDGCGGLG
jgi:hypothetical protein